MLSESDDDEMLETQIADCEAALKRARKTASKAAKKADRRALDA